MGIFKLAELCLSIFPSLNSTIWYQLKGGDAVWLGRQPWAESNAILPLDSWLDNLQADCLASAPTTTLLSSIRRPYSSLVLVLFLMYIMLLCGYLLLLGCVALVAQRPIVIELSRERSVGRSVCLSSALWKNGGSDRGAVWHRRSDGSSDEAGGGVWRSVHEKWYFWGRIRGAPLFTGTYRAYVCYSAATRPSCQITLGRLVIVECLC